MLLALGWVNALEAPKVHFITVQGPSALKILIYAAAAEQGGRQVEALKEKRQRRANAVSVFTLEYTADETRPGFNRAEPPALAAG